MEKILYKLAGSLSHDFSASWCLVFQNMSIQYGHLPYKIISRGSHLVGSWALTKLSTSCNPMFLTEVDYLVHERSIKRPKPYFLCVKSRWQRRTAHRSSTKSGFFDRALLGSQVNFATSKNWQSHNPEVHLDYVGWPKKERYKVFTIEACHFSPHSFVCFKNLKYWEAPKIKKTLWWSFTYKKWQQQPKPSSNLWKLKDHWRCGGCWFHCTAPGESTSLVSSLQYAVGIVPFPNGFFCGWKAGIMSQGDEDVSKKIACFL